MTCKKFVISTEPVDIKTEGATLLSEEEAAKYLSQRDRIYPGYWWTCSPGKQSDRAVVVFDEGDIDSYGKFVLSGCVYVRPALLISDIESSGLKVGDIIVIDGYEFKIILENLAWMHRQDIGCCAFKSRENWPADDANNYDESDLKRFVDEWYSRLTK